MAAVEPLMGLAAGGMRFALKFAKHGGFDHRLLNSLGV
jgi:hypothetical protein